MIAWRVSLVPPSSAGQHRDFKYNPEKSELYNRLKWLESLDDLGSEKSLLLFIVCPMCGSRSFTWFGQAKYFKRTGHDHATLERRRNKLQAKKYLTFFPGDKERNLPAVYFPHLYGRAPDQFYIEQVFEWFAICNRKGFFAVLRDKEILKACNITDRIMKVREFSNLDDYLH